MKIHGTAKGAALSTKDFGVAFGGGVPAQNFIDNPISDVWTVVNSSLWSIGSGRATCDGVANSNPNICRYDLQDAWGAGNNLSDTTWTIRWSAELNNVTGANGFHSMPIGLFSGTGATPYGTGENGISAMVLDGTGVSSVSSTFCKWFEDGNEHGNASYTTAAQAEDTQYWYELQRTALDDFTLKTYSDAWSTQIGDTWTASLSPLYSSSDVEAITDLRYVELGYRVGHSTYEGNGWDYLIEVYNNTLSP